MTPFFFAAAGLEAAINRYLRLDPELPPRLAALEGKVIAIGFSGLPLTLYVLPGAGGVRLRDEYPGTPDLTIRGTPLALLRVAQGGKGARAALEAGVDIDGDAHLAREFQSLVESLDIDWEDQASRWMGDPLAHQLGNLARGVMDFGRRATAIFYRDAGEFLREESRDLPAAEAVAEFLDAVDRLRSDVDRLEARIRRLRQTLPDAP
ncbi:MAG: SCP2 sterol-binding domain-containing protein [Pseudomonadota bacterium]|nr:SCP2 sterol-binding domain-containing protein [Pseudomonadota bacterium]